MEIPTHIKYYLKVQAIFLALVHFWTMCAYAELILFPVVAVIALPYLAVSGIVRVSTCNTYKLRKFRLVNRAGDKARREREAIERQERERSNRKYLTRKEGSKSRMRKYSNKW